MNASDIRSGLLVLAALASGLCGCHRRPEPVAGGLYSVIDDQGHYRTAKVVALDADGIHLRLYKNRWERRPKEVAPNSLALGTINDQDGFGVGHLVLTKEDFGSWKPMFLFRADLTPDELAGVKMWRQGAGGDFVDKP